MTIDQLERGSGHSNVRTPSHQPLTHAGSIELLNAVVEGVLEYLATVADPASERLGNALRLANGLVFETLPSEYAEVWA